MCRKVTCHFPKKHPQKQDFGNSLCLCANPISTQRQNHFPFQGFTSDRRGTPQKFPLRKFPPQNWVASVGTFAEVNTGESLCFQGFLASSVYSGLPKRKNLRGSISASSKVFSMCSGADLCGNCFRILSDLRLHRDKWYARADSNRWPSA